MSLLLRSIARGKQLIVYKRHNQFYSCLSNGKHHYWNVNNYNKKIIITSSIVALLDDIKHRAHNKAKDCNDDIGGFKEGLPLYTIDDVAKHCTNNTRVWVTYKEGVYDITEFVSEHPGGDQILLAAGSSVEPFWLLYAVHKNPKILNLLETFRIGNVSKEDAKQFTDGMVDPYDNDPRRHPVLKPASVKPFNAEVNLPLLIQNFITPNELFFVRNHLPVPEVDPDTYELEVVVVEEDKARRVLTLDDLKKFKQHTVTTTIMCAGNRRSDMGKYKQVKGLNWSAGAVGTATWTGPKLSDVLRSTGVKDDDPNFKHVQFEGIDYDPTGQSYGASIPFWRAMDKHANVILAYEMNGEAIPRDHGFPVRVVVPGVVGARSVKWLHKIVVSDKESSSHWQQNDYKGFSPSTDWDTADFSKSAAIQEMPVISAICMPEQDEQVQLDDGHLVVKGYAWSGGGQKILRVDVTIDGGDTWHVANLDVQESAEPPQHWAWTLWSVRIPVKSKSKDELEIWAKAVDSCYNSQPESFKNIWNLRGVLNNAYHRVAIKLK